MNTWNWLLHFLIIFDLVAFGIYFGGDILFTAPSTSSTFSYLSSLPR